MPITPWEKIDESEILAEGFGKQFIKQKFKDHLGNIVDFFFYNQRDWSTVLALTKNNNVIMTRQYKQGSESIVEELPAGSADFDHESPKEVIERELLEETGYKANNIIPLGYIWANSRNSRVRAHLFLAFDCDKIQNQNLDDSEEIEIFETPLSDFIDKALRGEIPNWDASILIFRALHHLNLEAGVTKK